MYLLDSDHLSILQRQRGPEFEALADMTEAVKALMQELETDDPMVTQRVERSGGLCKHNWYCSGSWTPVWLSWLLIPLSLLLVTVLRFAPHAR